MQYKPKGCLELVVRGLYSWLTARARRQYVSRISLTSSDKQRAWLGRCTSTTTCLGPELEFPSMRDLSSSLPDKTLQNGALLNLCRSQLQQLQQSPHPQHDKSFRSSYNSRILETSPHFCFRTTYAQQVRFICTKGAAADYDRPCTLSTPPFLICSHH